ncbi:MAG: ParA family protein [Candidatus Omnitrophica bacterium]|nr:ParA family protein [Candidatus Omnitrophota bacterium]
MPKIIAICNQKGGVGKTTTAINLSTALAISGKRVLLIDIDPQGNATSGLGIDKHSIKSSVYDLLVEESDPSYIIIKTPIENLSLIPSNLNLTGAEIELVGTMGREYRLKKAISHISSNFDFIIMDCPPSLGLLTINALSAAYTVLIPIQCEYYALEGLSQLSGTIDLVKENLNPGLSIEGVLLTMADFRTKLTNEVIDEVRKFFKDKVYNTVIPRNIRLTEAPGFGKPVALYDKHSIGALKYQEFTDEFLGDKKVSTDFIKSVNNGNDLGENEIGKVEEQKLSDTIADSV